VGDAAMEKVIGLVVALKFPGGVGSMVSQLGRLAGVLSILKGVPFGVAAEVTEMVCVGPGV